MKSKIIIILLLILLLFLVLFAFKNYVDNSVVDKYGMIRVAEDKFTTITDISSDNS